MASPKRHQSYKEEESIPDGISFSSLSSLKIDPNYQLKSMIGKDLNLKMILSDKLDSLFKKMDLSNYPYFKTNLQQDSYSFQ
jgi:hypothetical protein